MAGYILADSFGGLQQAENAQDSNRRMALAAAMNAATSGLQFSQTAAHAEEQLDLQRQAHEDEMAQRAQQLEIEMGRAGTEAQRYAEQSKLGKGYLDLYKQQLDWQKSQPTPAAEREHALRWSQAVAGADQGQFNDYEHVATIFPDLTEGEKNVLADESQRARANIEASYDRASHAAATLNRHMELNNRVIPTLTDFINKNSSRFLPDSDEVKSARQQLKEAQDADKTVAPIATRIQNDKVLGPMISFDPDNGAYIPAVPTPSWRTNPSQTQTAPPGFQPTTGRLNGQQWFRPTLPAGAPATSTQAPTTPAPAAGTASNGQPARKYSPWIYDRVNEIVGSNPNVQPAAALQQALREEGALFQ